MAYPIDNNFKSHELDEKKQWSMAMLRMEAKMVAMKILEYCPDSRERSVALTELETAMFWANAAIARN